MSSAWVRDPRALWRRCGDRVVVLVPDADEPMVLAGSGPVAWELLADPVEGGELVGLLAEHFEEDGSVIAEDLEAFLRDLADAGAVARR